MSWVVGNRFDQGRRSAELLPKGGKRLTVSALDFLSKGGNARAALYVRLIRACGI